MLNSLTKTFTRIYNHVAVAFDVGMYVDTC